MLPQGSWPRGEENEPQASQTFGWSVDFREPTKVTLQRCPNRANPSSISFNQPPVLAASTAKTTLVFMKKYNLKKEA